MYGKEVNKTSPKVPTQEDSLSLEEQLKAILIIYSHPNGWCKELIMIMIRTIILKSILSNYNGDNDYDNSD